MRIEIPRGPYFVHFSFESEYDGETDTTEHEENYWEAFWSLPDHSYVELKNLLAATPWPWKYVRLLTDVDTKGLRMGKRMKTSPFYRDGWWKQNRKSS